MSIYDQLDQLASDCAGKATVLVVRGAPRHLSAVPVAEAAQRAPGPAERLGQQPHAGPFAQSQPQPGRMDVLGL